MKQISNFAQGRRIQTIATIRDIFIIVSTGVLTVAVLVGGLWTYRLCRSLRRTAGNVEEVSGIIVDRVVRPLSSLPALVEVVKYVVGLVRQYGSRERRSEDGEGE